MPTSPLLSVVQAAACSGVSRRTIQRAITDGELKAHKLGPGTTAYVIDQADLDDYLAQREEAST